MKQYQVTFYDGKGKKYITVEAASANKAIAAAKTKIRSLGIVGHAILGTERYHEPQNTARHIIRNPKDIERLVKRRR